MSDTRNQTGLEAIAKIIRCPRCGASCKYSPANAFRPFCSSSCQNHDIIKWAEGTYRVAGPPADLLATEDEAEKLQLDEDL